VDQQRNACYGYVADNSCSRPTAARVNPFLRSLDGLDIVAADIVELNPPYDPAEVTAILAAFLSFDLLHLMGNARRQRSRKT